MTEIETVLKEVDLEDGEIESDGETQAETVIPECKRSESQAPRPVSTNDKVVEKTDHQKRKKNYHKNEKSKSSREKTSRKKNPPPVEDDIARNMEKALRKVLKKGEPSPDEKNDSGVEDFDNYKKSKKRKKHIEKDVSRKKRKHDKPPENELDEVDEDEMMCVRGASPVQKELRNSSPVNSYHSDDNDSYGSDASSQSSREPRSRFSRRRPNREFSERKGKNTRHSRNVHPLQDPDGVCLYFMQGKCHKGEDCVFSHDAQPPRKMELCKFYLTDSCAKRDKCLYMHSQFPCKFYHTGLPCEAEECKFAHGKPLSEQLKTILLKHIETAPKEILEDFPRLSRENAILMLASTQAKLQQQYSTGNGEIKEKTIPSLFELNIPKPAALDEHNNVDKSFQNNFEKHSKGSKIRQSRWCDTPNMPHLTKNTINMNNPATQNILNIQNLSNVLTPLVMGKLKAVGVEDLNQLSQLTVMQLNQIGLTMAQISDIQLNTLNIQKLGLISSDSSMLSLNASLGTSINSLTPSKDLDMRVVSHPVPDISVASSNALSSEVSGKDVDMRFSTIPEDNILKPEDPIMKNKPSKDSIDIDQYTQDALKFSTNEQENNYPYDEGTADIESENKINSDVDHRVLQYVQDASRIGTESSPNDLRRTNIDLDIRVPSQLVENLSNDKVLGRPTTDDDDDDDNLQIDEKWYSSDEDQIREETDTNAVNEDIKRNPTPPANNIPEFEPANVLHQLGDLSKIDISAEVTRLLTSLKNNAAGINDISSKEQLKRRDPRSMPKRSPEHKPEISDTSKATTIKKSSRVSIYECAEGDTTDEQKRTDVDLRQSKDRDFRMPSFGDTDLRQTAGSGDIDLRLALPFKAIPNYTPATEINGSIASHPPIQYKLYCVDIPRPNYSNIKNSTLKSQAAADPRLRKLFRLSVEESPPEIDKLKSITGLRADPRTRRKDSSDAPETPKQNTLDLQVVIQTSNWYKELSSNQKILVNQQLASVSSSLKKFHQDKNPDKVFDLTQIHSNNILHSIFSKLGISLDEKGNFSYANSQDGLGNQINYGPSVDPFHNNPMGLSMDAVNMLGLPPGHMGHLGPGNIANMAHMSIGNMGPMGNVASMGFDPRFTANNTRNQPGLLGIAPNMPHNFDGGGFNGMQSFPIENNFSNNFNGPMGSNNMNEFGGSGNEFGGGENETFYRKKNSDFNRGGFRNSRGNERRGRGSGNRGGGRDRRNYSDRGSWKSERR